MARLLVLLLFALTAPGALAQGMQTQQGLDLLVRFEVGGPATYTKRYQRPICPACASTASGVTIGIGYDLRHQTPARILGDWAQHPQRAALPSASGLGGQAAIAKARQLQHVVTPLPLAMDVLQDATLPRYRNIARQAFGPGMFSMPPHTQDALVSLVYNRGGSTVGAARREYRVIRDRCIPDQDPACVAAQIRAMRRLWVNTSIQAGMDNRRNAEADLAVRTAP